MSSMNCEEVAAAAQPIFEALKDSLETTALNKFVAIEPTSQEFFLGDTISDALRASRQKFPDRLAHVFRVGHKAGVSMGNFTR